MVFSAYYYPTKTPESGKDLTSTTVRRTITSPCRNRLKLETRMNPSLANAELAVMNLLWQNDESMTARQIREQLYPDEKKAQHGTVQRLLQRLEEKGFIQRDRSISVHFFSAAISRETYAGGQLESLADKLTAGSFAPLITHLVEHKKISRKEIDKIRSILDAHEDAKGKQKTKPKGKTKPPPKGDRS